MDYGETFEEAAGYPSEGWVGEAREETSLDIVLRCQLHARPTPLGVGTPDPKRAPRKHTVTVAFVAEAFGMPVARDDAKGTGVFTENNLPSPIIFDHERIISDYFRWKKEGFQVFAFKGK